MSARDDYPIMARASEQTAPIMTEIRAALDEIDDLRGEYDVPPFEDDPVAMALGFTPSAMALGFTPTKPGVLLPGTPEHCHRCALDEIDRLRHHVEQHLKRIHQLERIEA